MGWCCSHHHKTDIQMVFGHYGCYHSPPCVFFNAPNKLQNHNIHRDLNSNLLWLHIMCSRKSSIIREIFHTDYSSALEDFWEIRRILQIAWNSANSPNGKKFGEFAEFHASQRDESQCCISDCGLWFNDCLLVGWPRAVHESCVWLQWGEAGRLKWLTTTEHKCDACTKAFRISHDLYKQVDNDCG